MSYNSEKTTASADLLHGLERLHPPALPEAVETPPSLHRTSSFGFGGPLSITLVGPNKTQTKYTYQNAVTVRHFLDDNGQLEIDGVPVVAAFMNHEVVHLSTMIDINAVVEPITQNSEEGLRIYRKSLCFLLTMAASQVIGARHRLTVGVSIHNGYYFYYDDKDEIPQEDIEKLEKRMREIVSQDLFVNKHAMGYTEALEYFRTTQPYTYLLLLNSNEPRVQCYRCGYHIALFVDTLVYRTGILSKFSVFKYQQGLMIAFDPNSDEFVDNAELYKTFAEHKLWGKTHKFTCLGELNSLTIATGKDQQVIDQFIQVNEALHDKKIVKIAEDIFSKRDRVKVVLIAGPSSSGKTTTARKLALNLKVNGMDPYPISLDDYYLSRSKMKVGPDGKLDFEDIEALDLELLNANLQKLFNGERITCPRFNFLTGTSETSKVTMQLPPNGILILEGIHGLNDRLTPSVERDRKYKIFVSPITQINLDDNNRVSTTDLRLIRRTVRDYQYRGYSAQHTIKSWPSVRDGEIKWIFPFQRQGADATFNTALDYELGVLKVFAEPLLRTVKPDTAEYCTARRLLNLLSYFAAIPAKYVPDRSLLREFIGDSIFNVH